MLFRSIATINRVVVANVTGKGRKTRTIPMPGWVVKAIRAWHRETGLRSGVIVRGISRHGRHLESGLSTDGIYKLVRGVAKIGRITDCTPHTLRRTGARHLFEQGGALKQISLILGHESIKTTEGYIGLDKVDLDRPTTLDF